MRARPSPCRQAMLAVLMLCLSQTARPGSSTRLSASTVQRNKAHRVKYNGQQLPPAQKLRLLQQHSPNAPSCCKAATVYSNGRQQVCIGLPLSSLTTCYYSNKQRYSQMPPCSAQQYACKHVCILHTDSIANHSWSQCSATHFPQR